MRKTLTALFVALTMLLLPAMAASAQDDGARIHLIHGIPDTDVDVAVDGEVAIEGFSFSDTEDLSALAGQTLPGVEVRLAGTEDVAIDVGDLALPDSGSYTAIAHLDSSGTPTVTVFENDLSELEPGEGRLVVRHTAAAPAVDVLAGGDVAFAGVQNGEEGAADLPAGTVSASVVPAGATEPVVIGPADLPVTEGAGLIVYAVGSLDDETITVLTETIDGIHGTPNAVPTGNSPVDSASGAPVAGLIAVAAALGGAALWIRRSVADVATVES